MRPASLLVTGAAGYLGRALARHAVAEGVGVTGLDVRPPGPGWPEEAAFRQADVTDPSIVDLVADAAPEVVAHLAWVFDPTRDSDRERRVDVEGTLNVFRGAVRGGTRRIVYPSSTTCYGVGPARRVPFLEEDEPVPNPSYPYAFYKATVERWLERFRDSVPEVELVVFRACIVLGPGTDNVVARLTRLPVMPRVAGHDPPLQFLHEADAADMLWWGVGEAPPGTWNVAGDGLVPYSEVCRAAGRVGVALPAGLLRPLAAVAWWLRLVPFPPGLLDYIRYPWVADTGRLRAGAGFRPRYTSREALEAFVAGD